MGVAVSAWRLANAVSRTSELGVVSGSMLDTVFVRRLQDGDPGGHMRRAIAAFPVPEVGAEILRRYFNANGRAAGVPRARGIDAGRCTKDQSTVHQRRFFVPW